MFTLCDSFFFLLVLLYFIKYPLILSTLSVTFAGASKTLPLVINSTSQWLLFANKINANDSNFNSNKFFLLANDLDFANNSINPVGSSSSGFFGTLYGNKHSIKNVKINSFKHWSNNNILDGVFGSLNNASIYDLQIANNVTFNVTLNQANIYQIVGGLAAITQNTCNIVNVNSNVNITIKNTSTTTQVLCEIGGIVGETAGTTNIYKSNYKGTIDYWSAAANVGGNDCHRIGGLVGASYSNITIQTCSVTATLKEHFNGPNVGGIIGRLLNVPSSKVLLQDVVLNVTLQAPEGNGSLTSNSAYSSPDYGAIYGWASSQSFNTTNGSKIANIYIVGGTTDILTTPSGTALPADNLNAIFSNIQVPVASGTTITPSHFNTAAGNAAIIKKAGSIATVVTEANKNTNIKNNFNVSSSGAITSKLNGAGNIGQLNAVNILGYLYFSYCFFADFCLYAD